MPCCSRAVGRFHRRRGGPLLSRLNFHRKTGNLSLITVHKIIREKGERKMIQIYNGTLTSRNECCVHSTMKKADRVPIGYLPTRASKSALRRLWAYRRTRIAVDDALGVDFKELMPPTQAARCSRRGGRTPCPSLTGAVQRWVANQDGGYGTTAIFRWRKPTTRSSQTGRAGPG